MQRQSGPCAFSNACTFPGERVRMAGTNRVVCPVHGRSVELAGATESGGSEFAAVEFHAPSDRRRRAWATYAGIITGGF